MPKPSSLQSSVSPGATSPERVRRGVQSIEVGGQLLRVLSQSLAPCTLSALAAAAGLPAARAHAYLVSFGKMGLIEQNPTTGRYDLGPLALTMGLTALKRLDPARLGAAALVELAEATQQATALAVWGNEGPTVILFEESFRPVHVNLRPGTVMPLLDSATGQVFAAHLPPSTIKPMMDAEWKRGRAGFERSSPKEPDWTDIEAQWSDVRRRGLSRVVGRLVQGVHAFSAPVFDHAGHLAMALTVLGPAGTLDPRWDGPVANTLRQAASDLSAKLGHSTL